MQNSKNIQALLSIPKYGNGVGLHRMLALCSEFLNSDWYKKLKVVNVVGSNGKGSVSHIVYSLLNKFLDSNTGMYISPHLIEFNERISVNGQNINDTDLNTRIREFQRLSTEYEQKFPKDTIGAFEAFTTIAISHFEASKVSNLVMEAGIGGRYDSTRIVGGDLVALTSLDLEHTKLLGNTLEDIGYDKTDIVKEGGTVIAGDIDHDVFRKLRSFVSIKGAEMISINDVASVEKSTYVDDEMLFDFRVFSYEFKNVRTSLSADYQLSNILVAVAVFVQFLIRHKINADQQVIQGVVKKVLNEISLLGRFQRIQTLPDVYVDLAHTPKAIDLLVKSVRRLKNKRFLLVCGVSKDKNASEIVPKLEAIADFVVCTKAHHNGSHEDDIFNMVSANIPKVKISDLGDAVQFAVEKAKKENYTVLVAGGLFLSIEAFTYLKGKDPRALQFF